MKFSVVIPTFNRGSILRQTLAALITQDYSDYEVIVVDDGSTDGTREMVMREFPSVRYLRQANRGPAAARNVGIQAASGVIVAFTDDDCLPPADWLTRLADGYARHPEVVGVGGYSEAPVDLLEHNILARYERYMTREHYGACDGEVLGGFECPVGGTGNMSYRRSVLIEVGGFDEGFRYAAGEDADLKWRVVQKGHPLLYIPVRVTHLGPYTWRAFRKQQITHGRGAWYFEHKRGHSPGWGRIALRVAKRGLSFIPDTLRMGVVLAFVKMIGGWYDCWGQWEEMKRVRRPRNGFLC